MEIIENINTKYVAKLIFNGDIIAIYQGKSESGPRALGNRSFLFNPSISDGKNLVNSFKGRELFRPLSCSILHEEFDNWFETIGVNDCKFMTFSFKVKEEKKEKVESVIHIDGTCRVQTVEETDNFYFYNLIKDFYKISSIPILGNTSFNFAGQPLVETIEDSLLAFSKSELKFLYYPELSILLRK